MEEYLFPHLYKIENKHWWFVARQNIIWKFISETIKLPENSTILDIGCGTGAVIDLLSKKYEVHPNMIGLWKKQDVSAKAIEFCKNRGINNLFCGSLENYPAKKKYFNLITAFDVLEHVEGEQEMLKQINNLLHENGFLLLTVPAFPILWGNHDIITHHKRRYRKNNLKEIISEAGFTIEYISYFNFFLFPIAFIRRTIDKYKKIKNFDDFKIPSKLLNQLLRIVFELEKYLLPKIKFPFGVSLICLCRKNPADINN